MASRSSEPGRQRIALDLLRAEHLLDREDDGGNFGLATGLQIDQCQVERRPGGRDGAHVDEAAVDLLERVLRHAQVTKLLRQRAFQPS